MGVIACSTAADPEGMTNLVDMGAVPVESLKDTKICYVNKACLFRAENKVAVKEHSESPRQHGHEEDNGMSTKIRFQVRSRCGSKTHQFFKLHVTYYKREKNRGSATNTAFILKFPVIFNQRRATGKIEKIYFAKNDPKFSRRIKHGLIDNLAKKIHPGALHHVDPANSNSTAANSTAPAAGPEVTYLFEGEDLGGLYRARHRLRVEDNELVLLEDKMYRTDLDVQKHAKTKGVQKDGQKMAMKKKGLSKTTVGPGGRIRQLKQTDKANLGSTKKQTGKERPVAPTGSTGKTKFDVGTTITRLGSFSIKQRCAKANETLTLDIEQDIDDYLGGADYRAHHRQLDQLELMEEEEVTQLAQHSMRQQALALLHSGNFKGVELLAVADESNIAEIARTGRKLFADKKLSIESMEKVLSVVSSVRCDASYKELLAVLVAQHAPYPLRQQAVVALLHDVDEAPPPWYVVDTVADLASNDKDMMADQATMLLGALLSKHPEAEGTHKVIDMMQSELDGIKVRDGSKAMRSIVLLGALHNIGKPAHRVGPSVAPFLGSMFKEVRVGAIDCLHKMGYSYKERKAMRHFMHLPDFNGKLPERVVEARRAAQLARERRKFEVSDRGLGEIIPPRYGKKRTPPAGATMLVDDPGTGSSGGANGYDADNADDMRKDDGNREDGGRLSEVRIPLCGSTNFGVNVHLTSGSTWSAKVGQGFGQIGLEISVFFFKMEVMTVAANYAFYQNITILPSGQLKVPTGRMSLTVIFIMMKVLEMVQPITSQDLFKGGACPKKFLGPGRKAGWRGEKKKSLILFMFKFLFPVGPLPMVIDIRVIGFMGYQLIGAIFPDCSYQSDKGLIGVMGGFAPLAGVDIKMTASISIGVASAGIEGLLHILKVKLPLYGVTNTVYACGRIDFEIEALSGQIDAFVKILKKKFTVRILTWVGLRIYLGLSNMCKAVLPGHFPPLVYEKPKVKEKKKPRKKKWWEKKLAEQQEEEKETQGEDLLPVNHKTGPEVLRDMRRDYERQEGLPLDPKFGEDPAGWPFINSKLPDSMSRFKDRKPQGPHDPNDDFPVLPTNGKDGYVSPSGASEGFDGGLGEGPMSAKEKAMLAAARAAAARMAREEDQGKQTAEAVYSRRRGWYPGKTETKPDFPWAGNENKTDVHTPEQDPPHWGGPDPRSRMVRGDLGPSYEGEVAAAKATQRFADHVVGHSVDNERDMRKAARRWNKKHNPDQHVREPDGGGLSPPVPDMPTPRMGGGAYPEGQHPLVTGGTAGVPPEFRIHASDHMGPHFQARHDSSPETNELQGSLKRKSSLVPAAQWEEDEARRMEEEAEESEENDLSAVQEPTHQPAYVASDQDEVDEVAAPEHADSDVEEGEDDEDEKPDDDVDEDEEDVDEDADEDA